MTKIDIFSGFLGAGKTTLIKKLITEAFAGQQVVLIENEFGEIGIDGGFLKESGIQINELNAGCICCSLVGDFRTALQQVVEQYHPDRIVIEPSGVGKLSDVTRAVEGVAEHLGCDPRQAFFKVILPEISPAILSAFLICLTYSIDDFMISYFNCGTVETLPIAIYSMTRKKVSPEIYALSTIMFVVILSVILVSNAMESRSYRKDQKTLRGEGA